MTDYVKGKSAELIKATIESLLIFLIFRTCVMVICWLVEKKKSYILNRNNMSIQTLDFDIERFTAEVIHHDTTILF